MADGKNRAVHGLRMALDPAYRKQHMQEQWEKLKAVPGKILGAWAGLVKLTAGLFGAAKASEAFGRRVLEGQRDLRKFNASIANSFAKLDRQEIVLASRKAAATSGSTKLLADQYMALRQEIAPISDSLTNALNLLATGAVALARIGVVGAKILGYVAGISQAMAILNWLLGQQQDKGPQAEYRQFLREMAAGDFSKRKNEPPRKGKA